MKEKEEDEDDETGRDAAQRSVAVHPNTNAHLQPLLVGLHLSRHALSRLPPPLGILDALIGSYKEEQKAGGKK